MTLFSAHYIKVNCENGVIKYLSVIAFNSKIQLRLIQKKNITEKLTFLFFFLNKHFL